MRILDIDKKTFHYGEHHDRMMIVDTEGYPTGEYAEEYDTPVEMKGTFSQASGRASEHEFGTFIDYDFVIHIEDTTCPFDENAAIWLPGTATTSDPDGTVVRISESPTHTAIAVKKVR